MIYHEFEALNSLSCSPAELESAAQYLCERFSQFVKKSEVTLICFPRDKSTDLGAIAEQAVLKCGGIPVFWEKDLRWMSLLRLAFLSKASTIIAPPLIALGLTKLAIHERIPLCIYNVVVAGYPCLDWMVDGIEKEMDCRVWGLFGPGVDSVVSGFSCQCGRGLHIRDDCYGFEIVDERGCEVPTGASGRILLHQKQRPDIRYLSKAVGSMMTYPCPCGNAAPKIVSIDIGEYFSASLAKIAEEIQYWNSILECSLKRTESGLAIEVVCFRGEKLPVFPNCAKLVVRNWNPETDVPMSLTEQWYKP